MSSVNNKAQSEEHCIDKIFLLSIVFCSCFKERFISIIFLAGVGVLGWLLFKDISNNAIWMFIGAVASCLTTLIFGEFAIQWSNERKFIKHTQAVLRYIDDILYTYLEIARVYTDSPENEILDRDYTSSAKAKALRISDFKEKLQIIGEKSDMNTEKLIHKDGYHLKSILKKLKKIEKIISISPMNMEIDAIRYDISDYIDYIEKFIPCRNLHKWLSRTWLQIFANIGKYSKSTFFSKLKICHS